MLDFTFLTKDQIYGDKQLEILKKYGVRSAATDFARLLGNNVKYDYYTSEGESLKDRSGYWWIKSPCGDNLGQFVGDYGGSSNAYARLRTHGARPALPYSLISLVASNKTRDKNGIIEVEYGEYPQTIVSENFAIILEDAYLNQKLFKTGKTYTTDSAQYNDVYTPFQAQFHPEYAYNGKKYIRCIGDFNCEGNHFSNGKIGRIGEVYWIQVEPIKWMIDEKTNIALSKKILFSGIPLNWVKTNNDDFNETTIKRFMDEYFAKEIISNKELRSKRHKKINGKRKGIKVKDINIERIQEKTTDNKIDLKKDNEEERTKVKRKTK